VITSALKGRAGFVYLFKSDNGFYKIGKSRDPEARLKHFDNIPLHVELAHQIASDDAPWLERCLHKKFRQLRFKNEWYRLDDQAVCWITSFTEINRPKLPCSPHRKRRSKKAATGRGRETLYRTTSVLESLLEEEKFQGSVSSNNADQMSIITLRLPQGYIDALEELCRRHDCTRTDILRKAIRALCEAEGISLE
jgi:hypothetical protein